MRIALIISAFSLTAVTWSLDQLYQRQIKFGLNAKFASPTFTPHPQWEMNPLDPHQQPHVEQILSQPFTFFARGSQAYAFISPDQKYILKLFKQHKWKPGHLWGYLPFTWNPYYKNALVRKQKEYNVLDSCRTALRLVPEDTAVLYAHLNPTALNIPPMTLLDKHGKSWTIDLSRSCFLLQEKVEGFYPHLQTLMAENRIEEAKESMTSAIQLLDRFIELGIYEHNAILRKNFGFIGNRVIQFDIGKFKCDSLREPNKNTIPIVTKGFHRWINAHYPELSDHFDALLTPYIP